MYTDTSVASDSHGIEVSMAESIQEPPVSGQVGWAMKACFLLVFVIMLLFLVGGLVAGGNQQTMRKGDNGLNANGTANASGVPIFSSGDASHGFFSGEFSLAILSICPCERE